MKADTFWSIWAISSTSRWYARWAKCHSSILAYDAKVRARCVYISNRLHWQWLFFYIPQTVIDDENTNVVTAGAIVTVTVTLVRNNMSELFGNADVAEKQGIKWVLDVVGERNRN